MTHKDRVPSGIQDVTSAAWESPHGGDILPAVQDIIAEVMSEWRPLRAAEIRPEWALDGAPLAMDSVAFLRMVIAIEKRFGIMMADCDCTTAAMPTVHSVVGVVARSLRRGPDPA